MILIWMGFSLGLLLSAFLAVIYVVKVQGNRKNYYKGFIELAEGTKDWLYYFETQPTWRYKYVYPPLKDPELNRLIYEDPHYLLDRVHPEDYEMLIKKINGEVDFSKPIFYRIANFEQEYTWFEEHTTPVYKNGELVAIQGILRNVQEKMKLQDELDYRMTHDSLTGIHNRDFFESNMGKYNNEIDISVALILCDLDQLKLINDNYGHKEGDKYIAEAASLLDQFATERVIVSRIGGDEYCILVINTDEAHAIYLKESIIESIKHYNESGGADLQIQMSIGYSCIQSSLGNMEQLFVDADREMYQEKYMRKIGGAN
jgi:diguanylate cyclase (GGDEF)-like protein